MLWANKNGLMYVLERATGQFLLGKPFVEVNWLNGFDGSGRPLRVSLGSGTTVNPMAQRTAIHTRTARAQVSSTYQHDSTSRRAEYELSIRRA